MPLLWLRISVLFYAVGLLYALAAVSRPCNWLTKYVVRILSYGMLLHFVSLAETAVVTGHFSLTMMSIHESESFLAFMILAFFMIVYIRYRTTSPGIFVFPLVFLLTFASALAQQPLVFTSGLMRSGWIGVHVALIFTGYAALLLSFAASMLYIVQERSLKSKQLTSGVLARLPALQVIDDIGYKSLLLGFPFMTLGLIAGVCRSTSKFRTDIFPRSEGSSLAVDVGRLHDFVVHALEFRLARSPCRLSGYVRVPSRDWGVGCQLFQRDA